MRSKPFWRLVVLILLFNLPLAYSNPIPGEKDSESRLGQGFESRLREFAENMVSGGPSKDGIPPVDKPKYVPVSKAGNFLNHNDVVFLVEYKDVVKIFPQKILVWHEIVNDVIHNEKVSITYCPLTGSAIGFLGRFEGIETTFGTSGKLLNSNLVMYDRKTDSYFPQILGTAVSGPVKGKALKEFQVIWTTWEKAKSSYPDASVLSMDTGFLRSYGSDPYGSYLKKGTYYDSGGPFFPLMATDNRLEAKEVVVGVRIGNTPLAIVKNKVAEKKAVNLMTGDHPIVAFYDDSLNTVRIYSRRYGKKVLSFDIRDGKITDRESNSEWNVLGKSTDGKMKGTELEAVFSFDVMWFAWGAFYPQTEIYR